MRQQSFELKTWGGKRDHAGRESARERPGVPHVEREPFRASQPVHVSLRVSDQVWNLRSERSFRTIDAAFRGIRCRLDFRVVHFSVDRFSSASGRGAMAAQRSLLEEAVTSAAETWLLRTATVSTTSANP